MNFMVASVTPWSSHVHAPSFQVVHLDPDTLIPVNMETYAFDMDKANRDYPPTWNSEENRFEVKSYPKWDRLYNYLDRYELQDMSPKSFYDYATKMYTNETAAIQYMNAMRVRYPSQLEETTCDNTCRRNLHCGAITNDEDAATQCNDNDKLQLIPTTLGQAISVPGALDNIIKHGWYERKD